VAPDPLLLPFLAVNTKRPKKTTTFTYLGEGHETTSTSTLNGTANEHRGEILGETARKSSREKEHDGKD